MTTWTPPPAGTAPEPIWGRWGGAHCSHTCPLWHDAMCYHGPPYPMRRDPPYDVCYPAFGSMRTQLACARARAEAWHHSARKHRDLYLYAVGILARVEPASVREAKDKRIAELEAALSAGNDNALLRVYTQRINEHADRIRELESTCARLKAKRDLYVAHLEAALRDRDESDDNAITTAAREFVRLYGDGSYTPDSVLPMFAALDRLRDAVREEK
jgi:hypothetical protein